MSRPVDLPEILPQDGEFFHDVALRRQVLVLLAQQLTRTNLQISAQWEQEGHLRRGPLTDAEAARGVHPKLVLSLELELDPYEAATTPGALTIQQAAAALLAEAATSESAAAASLLASQRLSMDSLLNGTAAQPRKFGRNAPYSAMHERYRPA
jgi:hypothetical protein